MKMLIKIELIFRIYILIFTFFICFFVDLQILFSQTAQVGTAKIAKWKDNKKAVLVLQFDDSTPGQATLGIPAMNERNLTGTWYVNPGREAFNVYLHYWEILATSGHQELANHTMNHCGAATYEETEYEVGEASNIIWKIRNQENFSTLIAFNRGGGTTWNEEYLKQVLAEYKNIDRSENLGIPIKGKAVLLGSNAELMFDQIPFAIQDSVIAWVNFHGIAANNGNPPLDWGNAGVWVVEFERFLDMVVDIRDQIWIDGYIAVYKYIKEKANSTICMQKQNNDEYSIVLNSTTDTDYYDEPLTLIAQLPIDWESCLIRHNGIENRLAVQNGVLVFNALPNKGEISIKKSCPEAPTAPIAVTTTNDSICKGFSSILSYSGGSGSSFRWYSDSCGGTLIGTGNNLLVSPSETSNFFGRWENSCAFSSGLSITVYVKTVPDHTGPIFGDSILCPGSTEIFSVNKITGIDYTWELPTGWSGHSGNSEIEVLVGENPGEILVIPGNICGQGQSSILQVVPNINYTSIIQQPKDICSSIGDTVCFQITATGDNLSYQWKFESIDVMGADSSILRINSVQPENFGKYSVQIKGICGDVMSNEAILSLYTGLGNPDRSDYKIYPNPTSGRFFVQSNTYKPNLTLIIMDSSGKCIYRKTNLTTSDEINITDMLPGLYSVCLKNGNFFHTFKIIKL